MMYMSDMESDASNALFNVMISYLHMATNSYIAS